MSFIKGVDVAYPYQQDAYSTKGLSFVFVKATQGQGYTNPHQAQQIATAVKAKLVVGLYLFMEPGVPVSSQANYFKTHALVKPGYLIAVDWEGLNGHWSSSADKDLLIKTLKAAFPKNRVGLYTNRDGWLNHDSSSYCGDFLWIADPDVKAGAPRIQHNWTFHQYGISGGVDQDVANFQDDSAFRNWAGMISAPPSTHVTRTPEYTAVMLNDVFPVPEGHIDPQGTGYWTLESIIKTLFEMVQANNQMLTTIIKEIEADKNAK